MFTVNIGNEYQCCRKTQEHPIIKFNVSLIMLQILQKLHAHSPTSNTLRCFHKILVCVS